MKFHELDRFHIEGRGLVITTETPYEIEKPCHHMIDRLVDIDGKKYKIKGIECFQHGGPIRIGEKIGLWVEENE